MITQKDLALYLDAFLDCANYADYAPNGIQIEGKNKIERICTAVTAASASIDQAIAHQADALLVHHGYFWHGENPVIVGTKKMRISKLLAANITLFAYHLPLDCHLLLGNNAAMAKFFQFSWLKQHRIEKISNLLWQGLLIESMTAAAMGDYLENKLGRAPIYIAGSSKAIKNIAWCTGAAQDLIEQAHVLEADTYLSGEIAERTYYQALELGMHYFACGHHATERYGIKKLGEHLATKFSLKHFFIDSLNPV